MAYKLVRDQAGIAGYVGKAERCTFEFSTMPEQIPGETWLANQIIDKGIAELRTQGSELLWIKVWRDTAPIWQTNYLVEVTATASPLWWNLIIIGILTIVALVISWKIIKIIRDMDWGDLIPPISWGLVAVAAIAGIMLLTRGREKRRE